MELELQNGMTIEVADEEKPTPDTDTKPTGDNANSSDNKKPTGDDVNKPEGSDDPTIDDLETDDNPPIDDNGGEDDPEPIELDQSDEYVATILESSGEEFTDEEIVKIQSAEDPIIEATNLVSSKRENKARGTILDEYPDVKKFYEHLKNGGTEQEFFQVKQQRYSVPEEITEDDILTQRKVVREDLKLRGFTDEEIEEDLNDFEEKGLLYKKSQRSKQNIDKHYQEQEQQLDRKRAQRQENQKKQISKLKEDANNILSQNDEIAGLAIKDKKDGLTDYMFEPGEDGMSQYQKDIQDLPIDQVLAIGALVRNKFDIESFIRSKMSQSRAKSMKERIAESKKAASRSGGGSQSQRSASQKSTNIGIDDLDFEA